TKNKNIIKTGVILLAGILLGWLIFGGGNHNENDHTITSSDDQTIWTCSMHPQIRQNEPGSCPICGMDLIPLETSGNGDESAGYQMSENAMKLANIQTMIVGRGEASREMRLNGKVQVDERASYSQSTHIPGRIEQLAINFTGEKVNRGQTLATVYSPELVTAQEELLQAAAIKASQPELFEAAKTKLRNWKIGDAQIEQILAGGKAIQRFSIRADVNGIVTEKMVDLGDYVERGMPIYEISDLSKVWVLFDLYEGQLAWVKEGSKVEFTINSFPGETFEGTISFVDPLLDAQTRVATARVELNNKDGKLKPGMFASGLVKNVVTGAQAEQELIIPKSAVLWTGKRSIVYVKTDISGKAGFTLREITLGPSLGDSYIVQEGLEDGEEIVSNGAFTVDAAVQLSGGTSMMNPEGGKTSTGHDHGQTQQGQTAPIKIEVSEKVKNELNRLVEDYLGLKDALVKDDYSQARKDALAFEKSIGTVDGFNQESKIVWESYEKELKAHAGIISGAAKIEGMRERFIDLSTTMIGLVKTFGLTNGSLYVQHCPMADNDKGADWLSRSKEIQNPYYGASMLRCGEVTETLNK
ncbi:MAG TPA: efflux RND transporter periplasmic adaptor subunit, partial [Gillisia sp.]|nr:efflux RND transporter periplasmic adaptor subunit [Gillisia sp.]